MTSSAQIIAWIQVEVFDGINSGVESVQVMNRMCKRRDELNLPPAKANYHHQLYLTDRGSVKDKK